MQKEKPANVKGVEVSLMAIDPNGNPVDIGPVTTDEDGLFKKLWTPEIEGEYTVRAVFDGSESYWGSRGEVALGVVEAPSAPAEQEPTDFTPVYAAVVGVGIAIIVAIAIVGLLLARRKQ